MNINEFKQQSIETHNLIYTNNCSCTITAYNNNDIKTTSKITCIHKQGSLTHIQPANEYLLGCEHCHTLPINNNKDIATDRFVSLANIVHKGKGYMYKVGSSSFMCPVHGPQQILNCRDHLTSMAPCTSCDSDRLRDRYIKQANKSNKGNTNIYFVSFTSKTTSESFFKVGLCFGSLEDRFKDWLIHYDIKPIVFSTGSAEYLYDLEQKIHHCIKEKQISYTPMLTYGLGGASECFMADPETSSKLKSYIINRT